MSKPSLTTGEAFDITAIVCTYNRSALLGESLSRIARQQGEGLRYEVIVVDNNSTDGTREVIEKFAAASHCPMRYGSGSMEEHELLERLARAGKRGLYAPQIVVRADVPFARMTRGYHRRWHRGHGKFYAISRSASFEESAAGRLFDVPAHLYRQ